MLRNCLGTVEHAFIWIRHSTNMYVIILYIFSSRLIILHKRPTSRKLACAGTVMAAEFVCLLPSMVPSLENASQRHNEGGAEGPGRILWPLCCVSSMVSNNNTFTVR